MAFVLGGWLLNSNLADCITYNFPKLHKISTEGYIFTRLIPKLNERGVTLHRFLIISNNVSIY